MLLGLHTYSFHLHGMGQNWGGHQLAWERVWDIFGLMDEAKKLGLEIEFDPGSDGPAEARRREYESVVQSIRFAREELGVGRTAR
jgi:hypothetical protein